MRPSVSGRPSGSHQRLQRGERDVAQHHPALERQHDPQPRNHVGRRRPRAGKAFEDIGAQQARRHQIEHLAGGRRLKRRERIRVVPRAELRRDPDGRERWPVLRATRAVIAGRSGPHERGLRWGARAAYHDHARPALGLGGRGIDRRPTPAQPGQAAQQTDHDRPPSRATRHTTTEHEMASTEKGCLRNAYIRRFRETGGLRQRSASVQNREPERPAACRTIRTAFPELCDRPLGYLSSRNSGIPRPTRSKCRASLWCEIPSDSAAGRRPPIVLWAMMPSAISRSSVKLPGQWYALSAS